MELARGREGTKSDVLALKNEKIEMAVNYVQHASEARTRFQGNKLKATERRKLANVVNQPKE